MYLQILQGAVAVYSLYTMYESNETRKEMEKQKAPSVAETSEEAASWRAENNRKLTHRRVSGSFRETPT